MEIGSKMEATSCGVCLSRSKEEEMQVVKEECEQTQSCNCTWVFAELICRNKISFLACREEKVQHSWSIRLHCVSIGQCLLLITSLGTSWVSRPWTHGSQMAWRQISACGHNTWQWYVSCETTPEMLGSQRLKRTVVWSENSQGQCETRMRNHENQSQ